MSRRMSLRMSRRMSRRLPPVPGVVPQRGGPLRRAVGRAILRLAGWRVEGAMPAAPRFVAIAAPHSSNWDFVIGMAAVFGLGLDVRFIGKDTLFRPPLGWLMRALGGQPVNRRVPQGVVGQLTAAMRQHDRYVLGLAPQGTRAAGAPWRTGFYHIACAAGVPIFPVAFDYPSRTLRLGPLFHPTGELAADLPRLQAFYEGCHGRQRKKKRG